MDPLAEIARDASQNAHAPYSELFMGAALRASDGTVYRGCNVENISFGLTQCAERSAITAAVADGARNFEALVLTSSIGAIPPCGACRQVIAEFVDGDFVVRSVGQDEVREWTMAELLPEAFSDF